MLHVALRVILRKTRIVACAVLFQVLRLSAVLDRIWPGSGVRFRRVVLYLWWNVAMRLGARLRDRLRGVSTSSHPASSREHLPPVRPENLLLPRSATPVVSVIIPTYGQVPFTLGCLASIQAHPPAVPIEVIVVDDAFPGPEVQELSCVAGIFLLRNEVNLGFIRTCNAAARAARGEFLLFLNNDTRVLPGWLDRLLEVFATRPDVGLVGSKLIGDDGTLREAGGIVWKDGSAWNYGLGADPGAPEFNYSREVDYCSGASLLVRRETFHAAGGFDEKYVPAYCEDSDLAFRLRNQGLKIWYQPRSEIIHYEGISHGRDLTHGVKASQVTNQAVFLDTWHAVLARDHFLNGTHVMRARDRARDRQVVLVIDHYVPEPDRDAGSRTIMVFMRALLASGLVVKFWPANLYRLPGYTDTLQDMGVEVLYGPHQTSLPDWLEANGADLDVVLLSRPDVAEMCMPVMRAGTRATIAYYGHDLHFRRLEDEATREGTAARRRAAATMRAREIAIWRDVDIVLYPSEEEAVQVRALLPEATVRSVVPYAFEAEPPRRDPTGDASEPWIIFVAGFGHPPNIEAAVWFVREVLPAIVAEVPGARLAIVGSKPSAAVTALRGQHVSLFANVSEAELLAWYRRATVAVVPLLAGAGVKLKTVEALWLGVPAVITPVGAQGLPGVEHVLAVATEPADFASSVRDLLTDAALWRRRSEAASRYVRERFSEDAQRLSLLRALNITPPVTAVEARVTDAAAD